jgi:hypothetical protein
VYYLISFLLLDCTCYTSRFVFLLLYLLGKVQSALPAFVDSRLFSKATALVLWLFSKVLRWIDLNKYLFSCVHSIYGRRS